MKVLVLNSSDLPAPRHWIQRWMAESAKLLSRKGYKGLSQRELVVVFVTPAHMKKLNLQYRKKNYATDILSFEAAEPEGLGELVLCLKTIITQSKRTGLSPRGELGYMLVHGLLHLLGLDHDNAFSEKKMFTLQDELYAKLEAAVGLR